MNRHTLMIARHAPVGDLFASDLLRWLLLLLLPTAGTAAAARVIAALFLQTITTTCARKIMDVFRTCHASTRAEERQLS
jgi:hypothetical protein